MTAPIHPGRLHGVPWQAAVGRLAPRRLHSGKRLSGFTQDARGVTARGEDGSLRRGKALVGADGIQPVLRGLLHPKDGGIRWNGIQMWRGAMEWPADEGGDVTIVAGDIRRSWSFMPSHRARLPSRASPTGSCRMRGCWRASTRRCLHRARSRPMRPNASPRRATSFPAIAMAGRSAWWIGSANARRKASGGSRT